MTDQDRDTSLKDEGLSRLYHQGDKAEPDVQLDARIHAAAHDAVKSAHTKPIHSHHQQPWYALAAVIALVAILLPVMIDESEQILTEPKVPQLQLSPGKLTETEASREQAADAVTVKQTAKPATTAAPASASVAAPATGRLKSSTEKKSQRKQLATEPAEQAIHKARQEEQGLPAKQKAYGDQAGSVKAEAAAPLLRESTLQGDQQPRSAEAWQKHIWQLLHDDHIEQARSEIHLLRKTWPEFQIDPDLIEKAGLPASPGIPEPQN